AWWFADSTQAYTATATLAVQDPRTSIVFEVNNQLNPERYIADQIEIAGSRTVALQAIEQLAELQPPIVTDVEELLDNTSVGAAEATDLMTISHSHPTASNAVATANALADAYRAVSAKGAQATFADAINQLDSSIAELLTELDDVASALGELQQADPERLAIEAELQIAIEAVLNFQQPPDDADPEVIAAADAQLSELRSRVDLLQIALSTFDDAEPLDALQAEQQELRGRLGALQLRRDQLAVDAELAGNIIVFSDPAQTADASSGTILIALGIMGGAILGAIAAQSLARRRRSFHARTEPQSVLQTGLIADIPIFGEERLTTPLPTAEAPHSASAESFRFVATGIQLRQHSATDNPFKTVVVASATLADGKTTVIANTAIAAARSGRRVALIDADFVDPSLTRLLAPEAPDAPGLTDVVAGETNLSSVGRSISGAQGGSVTLFSRGTHGTRIPEFFASAQAAAIIEEIESEYDLVLIDAPPVLRLAHSGTVVRLADRVMIVVAHRSDIDVAAELQSYLSVVGVPILGYVYNFAPLRREMLARGGSVSTDDETTE
ncbi:MAG: AAA family ATPase, partial [bacterium]|nr:AAA family ATPase [bacterium]